jgi:sulfur-oxidizing protein SoxY
MRRIKLWFVLLSGVMAVTLAYANGMSENEDFVWHNGLRQANFGDREIIESDEIISLETPKRAEDAAVVPIRIKARIPQTEELYIKDIFLIIDNNPGPLAGRFHFTPKSGRADLSMRIRINAYTPVRAIAETNDGKLYMSKRFVKASGGCSAPAGSDLESALSRLGKIKLKARDAVVDEPTMAQLNISHPNITGLQLDQVTRLYIPAHFVKQIKVSFNGEPVMTAETDIAISEDPSFRFYFVPDKEGELKIDVVDSKDLTFSQTFQIKPM